MKICLPVVDQSGLQSTIAPNFGSAPWLSIVDTDTREIDAIDTTGGACRTKPIEIDMVICRGVGPAMFQRLLLQGIRVFGTDATTIDAALVALEEDRLQELDTGVCGCGEQERSTCGRTPSPSGGCGGNGGGCGCS